MKAKVKDSTSCYTSQMTLSCLIIRFIRYVNRYIPLLTPALKETLLLWKVDVQLFEIMPKERNSIVLILSKTCHLIRIFPASTVTFCSRQSSKRTSQETPDQVIGRFRSIVFISSFSRFVVCRYNYNWRQQKTQLSVGFWISEVACFRKKMQ